MADKTLKSPLILILAVLQAYPGCLFSVREIISEVYKKEGFNLDPETVRVNLRLLQVANEAIYAKLCLTEEKKIPVYKFTYKTI